MAAYCAMPTEARPPLDRNTQDADGKYYFIYHCDDGDAAGAHPHAAGASRRLQLRAAC